MELSSTWITIAAVVIALIAYVLGRNPVLWGLVGYLNPVIASIILLIRHRNVPKETPGWILEAAHKFKLRMWSRKLKPEDFDDGPPSSGALK